MANTTTKKMYNIEFGQFKVKNNIPEIEIVVTSEDGSEKDSYWLSAFRWYSFQVSGDDNGFGDFGSTPVFGLKTFGHIQQAGLSNLGQESTVKYLINTAALDAVTQFTRYGIYSTYYWNIRKPNFGWGKRESWDDFIDAVYEYAVNDVHPENTEERAA